MPRRSLGLLAWAILATALLAPQARADAFADCFHRIELACRHEVYASYGCTADGQIPKPRRARAAPTRRSSCEARSCSAAAHARPPRSTLDQCVSAATNHCAALLDAPPPNGGP